MSREQGATRLWALAGVLAVGAVLLEVLALTQLEPLQPGRSFPWIVLLLLFYVVEIDVVRVAFRRSSHSFSLSEIPIVLGLVFLEPALVPVLAVVGMGVALAVHRGHGRLKLAVNLGHIGLGLVVAVLVHRGLLGDANPLELRGWLSALAASQVAAWISMATILLAIKLSEGAVPRTRVQEVAVVGPLNTFVNTSLALAAAILYVQDPLAVWLLVGPTVTIYFAYRAYSQQRRRHASLEFLYESSRLLQQSPEIEEALLSLLEQARTSFRAGSAEVVVFPSDPDSAPLVTALDGDEPPDVMRPITDRTAVVTLEAAAENDALLLGRGESPNHPLRAYLTPRGFEDVLVAPLVGETRVLGLLVVGNRLGPADRFTVDDLRLFATLANHVSVSLEYGRLEKTLTQLTELKEQLRHQAFHDELTQLANRRLFTERVQDELRHRTAGLQCAVLFIDLDDFKTVNDSLGHQTGDLLLVEVAKRLYECLRPSDLAARLGGDEFAILLTAVRDVEDATNVAERINEALRRPFRLNGTRVTVRGSLGVALSAGADHEAEALLRNADVAMYRAKTSLKGQYAVFEPGMHDAVIERLQLRAQLEQAVDRQEFRVYYQPLIDLSDESVLGFEALVRWQHPERGLIAPAAFIGLAEETGLIVPIGRQVLQDAVEALVGWQARYPRSPRLAVTVNLSARQLQDHALIDDVRAAIESSGVTARDLTLEITETVAMQHTASNIERLRALKALGVRLAIDDFGTGYSSLAYLRRFPIDVLKVAKPFVDGIEEGTDDARLAQGIIELAHALGLTTVAEGIEHRKQHDRLREWACDVGQGYHYARPMPPEEVELLLSAQRGGVPVRPA
ncbi:MAG TPA: EAL domain-containing protein [Nitriliruptorales bacterium]